LVSVLVATSQLAGCFSQPAFRVTRAATPFGKEVAAVLYLDPGHFTAVALDRKPNLMALELLIAQNGVTDRSVPAGTTVHVAFTDGSPFLTLRTAADVSPVATPQGMNAVSQWRFDIPLDAEASARLSATGVAGFEIENTARLVLNRDQTKQFQDGVHQVLAEQL
jgi:hypothetical protein